MIVLGNEKKKEDKSLKNLDAQKFKDEIRKEEYEDDLRMWNYFKKKYKRKDKNGSL